MNTVYDQLQPREVWRHFDALNQIPRPSGQEAAARDYVIRTAAERGAQSQQDARGNCVVRVAATPGRENTPLVALQSHLDMVCEKRPEVAHDFSRDPILPRREGDWIYASGTTLGADNGLGAAMMLAALTDETVQHGPLELLFTIEEETGLFGAAELDTALLAAELLINLDSEDPDEITVGCAGGAGAMLHWHAAQSTVEIDRTLQLKISGLAGGHSGMQIHEPLGNALKILVEVLRALDEASPLQLVSVAGGNAHNAIPRDASAVFAARNAAAAQAGYETARAAILQRWSADEPELKIELQPGEAARAAWSEADSRALLELLHELPHGVLQMSEVFEGKVETSANLATVRLLESNGGSEIEIHVSVRSFRDVEIRRVLDEIAARGAHFGATCDVRDGYPGWEPQSDSALLERTREAFVHTQGREPMVHVVHAGLECGILVRKKPGLEAVSFGPHIRGAHTPEECAHIPSLAASWSLLTWLLDDLSK